MKLLVLACVAAAAVAVEGRFVLPSLTSWTPPDFCHDKECPVFTDATPKDSPYEVRDYKKSTWALYTAEGSGFVVAEGKAYTQLTRYFGGANEKDHHIDLTTPAITTFVPTDADYSGSKDNYTVAFYLPHAAPKPQVDGVYLKDFPAATAYVRSFGGYASEGTILQEAKTLRDQLLHDKVDIEEDFFMFATYDSAARLFDRHNEVVFGAGVSRLPQSLEAAQDAAESALYEAQDGINTLYHKLKKALMG